jgi:membrane-bound lytic murein transglycosylase B
MTTPSSQNWTTFFIILILFVLAINTGVAATNALSWSDWVQGVRQEALTQGINAALFDKLFAEIPAPHPTVLHLQKTQPEKRITFLKYRSSRIDPLRIRLGKQEYRKHQVLLEQIGHTYHVDPCAITAIWGIETSYGHYMGDFSVIRALATLAYQSERSEYFRNELLIALHILNEGHITPEKFKGEWAGASGHPQFMPSSWRKYAIDYEQDGHKDIWGNKADALASLANYLKENGWQEGQPWAIEVQLPDNFAEENLGLKQIKTVDAWLNLGIKPLSSIPAGQSEILASIVKPNGGPAFMVFNNFRVFMKYNNSVFYAGSVGYLADQICSR